MYLRCVVVERVADDRRRQSEHGVGGGAASVAEVSLVAEGTCCPSARPTRQAVPVERRRPPARRRVVVAEAALQRAAEGLGGGAEEVMSIGGELELVMRGRGRSCSGCGVVEMDRVRIGRRAARRRRAQVMMVVVHPATTEVHSLLVGRGRRRGREAVGRREVGRLEVGGCGGGVGGGVAETVRSGDGAEAAGDADITAQLVQRSAEVSPILHAHRSPVYSFII